MLSKAHGNTAKTKETKREKSSLLSHTCPEKDLKESTVSYVSMHAMVKGQTTLEIQMDKNSRIRKDLCKAQCGDTSRNGETYELMSIQLIQ